MKSEYNPSNWELTKRLLGYIKPYMGTYLLINLTAFGREGVYSLLAPLIVMLIIDFVLVPTPGAQNWFIDALKVMDGSHRQGRTPRNPCRMHTCPRFVQVQLLRHT